MPLDGLEPIAQQRTPVVPVFGDTVVWAVRLDVGPLTLNCLSNLLSPDELARAARLHHFVDRARFIAGLAQLREILGDCLDEAAASLRFEYSAFGKPSLSTVGSATSLNFNASGSEGLGLVALRRDAAIGVDVERRRPLADMDRLAAQLLAADEHAEFMQLLPAERERRFFDTWVRKEALVKALGTGLRDLTGNSQTTTPWVEPLALPEAGYAAAIASPRPFGDVQVRWWTPMA